MKKNVFVFSRLAPAHLDRLRDQFNVPVLDPKQGDIDAQLAAALPETHGMIGVGRPLGAKQLAQATQLEVISSVSVGYDNYDLDYLNQRGIPLTNTPDVLTETTADLGFALMMAAARRTAELDAWTKAGQWKRTVDAQQFGVDVHGKKLGILGLGRIGAAIARRGRFGFNMDILYHGNSRKPELEQELGARFCGFDELLGEADFVCVVVPLGAKTRKLIGTRELDLMKPTGDPGQHRPRPGDRRGRAGRRPAGEAHPRRRPGRLREGTAGRIAAVRPAQRRDPAAHRLGHPRNPPGHGRVGAGQLRGGAARRATAEPGQPAVVEGLMRFS